MTLIGHDFFTGCNDAVSGTCEKSGQVDPMHGAVIGFARAELDGGKHDLWVKAGRSEQIATVDADDEGRFTLGDVAMPTEPGRYLITAAPPGWDQWIATWLWVK